MTLDAQRRRREIAVVVELARNRQEFALQVVLVAGEDDAVLTIPSFIWDQFGSLAPGEKITRWAITSAGRLLKVYATEGVITMTI